VRISRGLTSQADAFLAIDDEEIEDEEGEPVAGDAVDLGVKESDF